MKKILALVVVALFAAISFGDAIPTNTASGVYELTPGTSESKVSSCSTAYAPFQGVYFQRKSDGTFSSTIGWDSLNGASDKCTLLVNYVPRRATECILQYDTVGGAQYASVKGVFAIYPKSSDGKRLGRYVCTGDSLLPSDSGRVGTGNACYLPFGTKVFGDKYDVVIEAIATNGAKVALPVMRLFGRLPVTHGRTKAPIVVD